MSKTKEIKPKHAGGRPTKYTAVNLSFVKKCATYRLTDIEIADLLGIGETTLNVWKKKHKEFRESLKEGKNDADSRVERALYERATGYSHPEEKIFQHNGVIVRTNTTKHYAPDTAAAFIWLKNRQPTKWRDKQEMDVTIKGHLYDENKGKSPQEIRSELREVAREIYQTEERRRLSGIN